MGLARRFLDRLRPGIVVCIAGAAHSRTGARRAGCGAPTVSPAPTLRLKSPYAAVLRLPTMWWIILSGIFHNFNMYAINAFQTPFLQRFHEMSLREASNVSALSVGAVGAIGLLAGGWLADKFEREAPQRTPAGGGLLHGDCGALHLLRAQSAQGRR